jgi:hypothetical protein
MTTTSHGVRWRASNPEKNPAMTGDRKADSEIVCA